MKLAALVRALLGLAELTRPSTLAARHQPDTVARRAIQFLGVRDLVQAGLTVAAPSRRVLRAGVAVDVVHGVSMLALAAGDRRRRPLALASAALAGAFAATGAVALRSGHDLRG